MTKKSIELSDLPPEILQLLVENCDLITRFDIFPLFEHIHIKRQSIFIFFNMIHSVRFLLISQFHIKISRCRLRASSFLLYQIVNSTKLYIPSVKMELQKKEVEIKPTANPYDNRGLLFEKNLTDGTPQYREEMLINNSDHMDETIDWFRQICLQKNVTIGRLDIDTSFPENPKRFTEKLVGVLEKSEIPLKVKSIEIKINDIDDWMWKIMEYCDKRVLKGILVQPVCDDEFIELFGKQDETLKNLEKIEITCLCNATDEDVLSLNASVISLNSENFTVDLAYKLIEKFTNRREDGSTFWIHNTKKPNMFLEMIPPVFKEAKDRGNGHKYYSNELINQPTVYLRVDNEAVELIVGHTAIEEFWGKDESDNDTSDDSDANE
ncbi:hypothetical protein CRE_25634 [Caenorhabditis remanei]|uniref:F-box domain-containing protein n=1 Tax=Caenorhabditis remanei TaxID=31234 RepID=E3ML51_CAERE|nr:hypothetical protein CRE_25634 [Caenorhabditis remanei]